MLKAIGLERLFQSKNTKSGLLRMRKSLRKLTNSQQSVDLMERKDLRTILQSALNAGADLTDGSPTGVETDAN